MAVTPSRPLGVWRMLVAALTAAAWARAAAAPCGSIPASAPWTDCVLDTTDTLGPLPPTGVAFASSDAGAKALFDKAEACAAGNRLTMGPGFDVMVEGGGYHAVWLETQPMAGGMYAARNLTLAANNQLIFVRTQREDGRLPGMVTTGKCPGHAPQPGTVHPTFSYPNNPNVSMLQGFFMATPAVDTAWFIRAAGAAAAADRLLDEVVGAWIPPLPRPDTWPI